MKRIALALAFAATISAPAWSDPAEVSAVLKSTSSLMKERKFSEAQKMIVGQLKKTRNSHKLWLALGYVMEADGQFEKALKAFYEARNLKTGIEGLPERISRLENLLKNTGKDNADKPAASLLAQARYQLEMKNTRKGLILFAEAVLADQSLIGSEGRLVDLGNKFFSDSTIIHPEEEKLFFGGLFLFFAGNYDESEKALKTYASSFPDGDKRELAQKKLEEIKALRIQLKEVATPKTDKPKIVAKTEDAVGKAPKTDSAKVKNEPVKADSSNAPPPAYIPSLAKDEYAEWSASELFTEAMNLVSSRPTKAISLLSRATRSGSAAPEHYMTLADLYSGKKGFEKEAVATYRSIIEKFPDTELAKEARQKILSMNPDRGQRAKEVADHFSNK